MNHSALVVGFGKGHRSVVALKAKKPPGRGAERGLDDDGDDGQFY